MLRSVLFTVLLQVVTVVGPIQPPVTTKVTSYSQRTGRTLVELYMSGSWDEGHGLKHIAEDPIIRLDCSGGKLVTAELEVRHTYKLDQSYGLVSVMDGKRVQSHLGYVLMKADEIGPAYTLIDVHSILPSILRSKNVTFIYRVSPVAVGVVKFTVDGAELVWSACGLK